VGIRFLEPSAIELKIEWHGNKKGEGLEAIQKLDGEVMIIINWFPVFPITVFDGSVVG
jgi:hypothetical protein